MVVSQLPHCRGMIRRSRLTHTHTHTHTHCTHTHTHTHTQPRTRARTHTRLFPIGTRSILAPPRPDRQARTLRRRSADPPCYIFTLPALLRREHRPPPAHECPIPDARVLEGRTSCLGVRTLSAGCPQAWCPKHGVLSISSQYRT